MSIWGTRRTWLWRAEIIYTWAASTRSLDGNARMMNKRGILVWVTVGVRPYRAGNDGRVSVGRRLFGSGDGRGKARQAEASEGKLRLLGGRPADVALLVEGPRREVGQDAAAGRRRRPGAGVCGTFSWLAGDCRMTNGGPGSRELPQVHYKRA
jgi:hypothetical protein